MRHLNRVLVVTALGVVAALLMGYRAEARALLAGADPRLLALSLTGAVAVFLLDAWGWHLILKAIGAPSEGPLSVRLWMLSSLARYLPGGVWGYASRASLAHTHGIALADAALSLYLETVLLAAAALAVGLPALATLAGPGPAAAALLVALSAAGVAVHPRMLALLGRLPGRAGRALSRLSLPGWATLLRLCAYYVAFWLAFAAVFLLFVLALYRLPPADWVAAAAALPLAFAAGFVVVFMPGGIGVREGVMVALLAPMMPLVAAGFVAVAARIWLSAAELVALALASAWAAVARRASGGVGRG